MPEGKPHPETAGVKGKPHPETAGVKGKPQPEASGVKEESLPEAAAPDGRSVSRILEGCVDSVESAVTAWGAGADRLELCANLMIGGTTPSLAAFRQVKRLCRIPVHVLIRPRPGDFCYTEQEFALIREEISIFRKEGADGIVIGILKPDGRLDLERMKLLTEDAGSMSVTLHRAFDMCADPYEALEQAAALGIHTILTSGGRANCIEGISCLRDLTAQAAGRIRIMAGGGVDASVILRLFREAGVRDFHMSGKMICQSPMTYRRGDVHMGAEAFGEYELWRADGERFREAARVLRMAQV
ncbi:MAG: copper homeostasis protein CutC [Acetatifactor sp.]|nr:copper homeostasis protein CutC [Acetatifactor sp.]